MSSFEVEKAAMLLDRRAVLQLVSMVRRYRQAAETLLSKRYRDGEVDAFALKTFERACQHIEADLGDSYPP